MITSFEQFAESTDYSLLTELNADPNSSPDGQDHHPRQVFSGHYVPVMPTPLPNAELVAFSRPFLEELGFSEDIVQTNEFQRLFSGNLVNMPSSINSTGWATGYALSIFGQEYTQQCPFQTGNGYGDGRAISVIESVINGKRWEMQLKGGGRTPYCRGGDGRAVLRSSVREFLAQEHMHGLGIPSTRSLSLFVSKSEQVTRPWYSEESKTENPDIMVSEPVAITTRVASSFLRVGQIELFARRVRNQSHANAKEELSALVLHAIDREYRDQIEPSLPLPKKLVLLCQFFRDRLTTLIANWIRVGYCQGNFNSDNCAVGGFTLDYGPFGFCERFDPVYQPWVGGGQHFSFLYQPVAAEKNFSMFCSAVRELLHDCPEEKSSVDKFEASFATTMENKLAEMWASKLGLKSVQSSFIITLLQLMSETSIDYTVFFRELSNLPKRFSDLHSAFYSTPKNEHLAKWETWFVDWQNQINGTNASQNTIENMKNINPKYIWREWLIVPAYQQASQGNYRLIDELSVVLNSPFAEHTKAIEEKYYRLRPAAFFNAGGVSHYSCSS